MSLLLHTRSFSKCQQGLAYLEFAISLPLLIMLLLGGIEYNRYLQIVQKAEKTAITLSNVISQGSTVSNVDLDGMIFGASQVMLPYVMDGSSPPGKGGYVIVSSIQQTGAGNAGNPPKIMWQYTSCGVNGSWTQQSNLGTVGQTVPADKLGLPGPPTVAQQSYLNDGDNIITTEMFYDYEPLFANNGVISPVTITKMTMFKPRRGSLTTCAGCSNGC